MYADDLVLLSASINDLQILTDITTKELDTLGLGINCNKSSCLRIGARHSITPLNILINGKTIDWVSEITYLGISIVSSKHFKVNLQPRKQKFFRVVNAIFSKIGTLSATHVVISLVETQCVPILLYGLECIELSKSMMRSIENAYSQVYSKLFYPFDKKVIKQCQFYTGQLPAEYKIIDRRLNFLSRVNGTSGHVCCMLDPNKNELKSIVNDYNININLNMDNALLCKINWKYFLHKIFERSLTELSQK